MRGRAAILGMCLSLAVLTDARAAELWMFEEPGCEWCERWDEEIGVVYHKTDEGKRVPLRRADLYKGLPEGIAFASRPRYTPTFVLVHEGRELSRIEGYPGEDFFWGLLGRMLEALPAEAPGAAMNAPGESGAEEGS